MIVKIVGKRKIQYTKKTGEPVLGTNVYYIREDASNESGIEGNVCGEMYVSNAILSYSGILVGKSYVASYDISRSGKAFLVAFEIKNA